MELRNVTLPELHKKFCKIEDQFRPYEKTICGFHFWDCIRYPLFYEILLKTNTIGETPRFATKGQTFSRRKNAFIKFKNSIWHNPFLKPDFDFYFWGPRQKRRKIGPDGMYWDPYCDPIIDYIGRDRCLLLDSSGMDGLRNRRSVHTKNLVCTDYFYLIDKFKKMDLQGKFKTNGDDKIFINKMQKEICSEFDVFIDLSLAVSNYYYNHHKAYINFRSLLSIKKPKAVFLVCSYGKEALINACRSLSIPTIEIQHGTTGPYHLGYSFTPPSYKTLFPDFFLSFGRFWEETVHMPIKRKHVFTVGFPYFDRHLKIAKRTTKKKQIVFISQGPVGRQLSHFAVRLSEILNPEYNIVYKLHPLEFANWQIEYPDLLDSSIKVVSEEPPTLYEILERSEIQVGVYSSALYEGLEMGCKTFIVDLYGVEYMKPLIDRGVVRLVQSPSEIETGFPTIPNFDKNYFFADNWRSNLENALNCISVRF